MKYFIDTRCYYYDILSRFWQREYDLCNKVLQICAYGIIRFGVF